MVIYNVTWRVVVRLPQTLAFVSIIVHPMLLPIMALNTQAPTNAQRFIVSSASRAHHCSSDSFGSGRYHRRTSCIPIRRLFGDRESSSSSSNEVAG